MSRETSLTLVLLLGILLSPLVACSEQTDEKKAKTEKPQLFQTQLNALEKAKKVEGTLKKSADERRKEVDRQDR